MKATDWLEYLGQKADIVRGEPVPSADGFLTVSQSPAMNVLLIDKWAGTVTPVVPRSEYRGRAYLSRSTDCVRLYAEWSDNERGTDLMNQVNKLSRRDYVDCARDFNSLEPIILSMGFTKVETPEYGDLVLLGHFNHFGAYLGDNRVLHHLQNKFSSIDTIELSELHGVYRHAN